MWWDTLLEMSEPLEPVATRGPGSQTPVSKQETQVLSWDVDSLSISWGPTAVSQTAALVRQPLTSPYILQVHIPLQSLMLTT